MILAAVTIAAFLAGEAAAEETLDAEKVQRIEAVERGGEDAAGAAVDLVKIYLCEDDKTEAAYWLLAADALAPGSDDVKRLHEIAHEDGWERGLFDCIMQARRDKAAAKKKIETLERENAELEESLARANTQYNELVDVAAKKIETLERKNAALAELLKLVDTHYTELAVFAAERGVDLEELLALFKTQYNEFADVAKKRTVELEELQGKLKRIDEEKNGVAGVCGKCGTWALLRGGICNDCFINGWRGM
ncbi:MAG: hypothetical protein IJ802_05125 [Kiritimatiellae bacterium]|nr:hypothetical protein [Kiritimatiellia bacterium]